MSEEKKKLAYSSGKFMSRKERHVAVYLAKIMSGRKNSEVGEYFGIKAPAVSVAIKAIEERLVSDKKLRKEIAHLKEKVKNE